MIKCRDLTGQRFGRLVVVSRAEDYVSPKGSKRAKWFCRCDCGKAKVVVSKSKRRRQPLYSKVLTPEGFIRMGDIRVGTKVISGTGNVCNVTGVYPQGVKPIYELTFDDGSKCKCSDEHLWTVQTRDDRRRKNKDGSEKYRFFIFW